MAKKNFKDWIVLTLGSALFSGYAPVASGTVASLFPSVPLYLLLIGTPYYLYGGVIVVLTFICAYASGRIEKMINKKDPSIVTLDEVVGFLITMFAVPPTVINVVAGFFIFRFFDIAKVPPARQIEKHVPGGWGVTLDDVVAGLWSQLCMRILLDIMAG